MKMGGEIGGEFAREQLWAIQTLFTWLLPPPSGAQEACGAVLLPDGSGHCVVNRVGLHSTLSELKKRTNPNKNAGGLFDHPLARRFRPQRREPRGAALRPPHCRHCAAAPPALPRESPSPMLSLLLLLLSRSLRLRVRTRCWRY